MENLQKRVEAVLVAKRGPTLLKSEFECNVRKVPLDVIVRCPRFSLQTRAWLYGNIYHINSYHNDSYHLMFQYAVLNTVSISYVVKEH